MSTTLAEIRIDRPDGVLDRLTQKSLAAEGACRLWLGAQRGAGYGAMKVAGRVMAVHQIAYVLARGTIPRSRVVRHLCGCTLCINPDHLALGTDRDNALDAVAHGTAPGFRRGGRIDARVRQAVLVLSDAEFSTHEIHRLLDVRLSTVKDIVRGSKHES